MTEILLPDNEVLLDVTTSFLLETDLDLRSLLFSLFPILLMLALCRGLPNTLLRSLLGLRISEGCPLDAGELQDLLSSRFKW